MRRPFRSSLLGTRRRCRGNWEICVIPSAEVLGGSRSSQSTLGTDVQQDRAPPTPRSASGFQPDGEGVMRIEYNPRKFLLLVPFPMLRQYFDHRGVLSELPWDSLKEDDYEAVYAAWQALSPAARETIGADFLNVAGLATKQGVQVILEEGKFHGRDLVAELSALPSHTEKVFHSLLQYPRVFQVASQLNYADNLTRYWHRRHDLRAQGR